MAHSISTKQNGQSILETSHESCLDCSSLPVSLFLYVASRKDWLVLLSRRAKYRDNKFTCVHENFLYFSIIFKNYRIYVFLNIQITKKPDIKAKISPGYISETVHPACRKRRLLGISLWLLTKVRDPLCLKTEVVGKGMLSVKKQWAENIKTTL